MSRARMLQAFGRPRRLSANTLELLIAAAQSASTSRWTQRCFNRVRDAEALLVDVLLQGAAPGQADECLFADIPEAHAFRPCQRMTGWHDEDEAVERERQELQRPHMDRIGDDSNFRDAASHRPDCLRAETFVQIDINVRMVCEIEGESFRKKLRHGGGVGQQ
jgi:hypothetical protein